MNENTVYYGLDSNELSALAELAVRDPNSWGALYNAFKNSALTISYGNPSTTYHLVPITAIGELQQGALFTLGQEDIFLDNFYLLSQQWVGDINPQ